MLTRSTRSRRVTMRMIVRTNKKRKTHKTAPPPLDTHTHKHKITSSLASDSSELSVDSDSWLHPMFRTFRFGFQS